MTSGFVLATDPATPPRGLERAVYAIGNFDGLHIGHQAVLERTRRLAEERGAPSALLTFEPHPADYFAERPVAFRLTPPDVKASVAERLGLSGIVFVTFDASLAGMTAEEFVRTILVERLGAARRRRRLGLPFRQGANRDAGLSCRCRAPLWLRRRDRRQGRDGRRGRRARRVVDRDPSGAGARRRRRSRPRPRPPLRRVRAGHSRDSASGGRSECRPQTSRSRRPTGWRTGSMRSVAMVDGRLASRRRELRRPADRGQWSAAARSPPSGLRRRSLWSRDGGRVRRAHPGGAKVRFACGAGRGDATRRGARARHPAQASPDPDLAIPGKSSKSLALVRPFSILARNSHDRRARKRLRLFADALSAEDGLSDAGGAAAEGAGNSRALGARRPLRRSFARAARAGRNSCCTTDRPTPTATSISGTR